MIKQVHRIYIKSGVLRDIDRLQTKYSEIIYRKIKRKLTETPRKEDKVNIRHIIYDLYELKISIYRFYYFVYNNSVVIVDSGIEDEITPVVDIFISSRKDKQKFMLKQLRKDYKKYYGNPITRDSHTRLE